MSQRFAITSLDEARAYLAHPMLGARLRECAGIVLATRPPEALHDSRLQAATTDTEGKMRIISPRRATKRERHAYEDI